MRKGTKTLLFGMHHFVAHPILLIVAWKMVYRRFPSFKEMVCIIIHDWGYWGKRDVDGSDGENHPELGARIAGKLFGDWGYRFVAGHSQTYAKKVGIPPSELWFPDKLAASFPPTWMWILLGKLTGELDEYMHNPKYSNLPRNSPWIRFGAYKRAMAIRLEKGQFHPQKTMIGEDRPA